jgi:hypothetical protein
MRILSQRAVALCRGRGTMTTTIVSDLLRQRPFKPFRVVMSSGEAYEVRHPEMASVTKNDLFVGIDAADDGLPADARICPLFHVATLEPLATDTRAE